MTDAEWRDRLEFAISGKSAPELRKAKEEVFRSFAHSHPDEYAWKEGNRKNPTGESYIASRITEDMRRVFGVHYEDDLGEKTARFAASMYY